MTSARLVSHQLRYDLRLAWRNPQSRFFTIALPLIFLVLLTSLFGDATHQLHGQTIKNSIYYVPGLCSLAVISTSFVNLTITIVAQRETGVLQRRRSTPVSAWVLIASRALTAAVVSTGVVVVMATIGYLAYGVSVPAKAIPALLLCLLVGSAAFCALAYAIASFISSQEAAQPIVQATMLPLYFISGVFVPKSQLTGALSDLAGVFPVAHLNDALFAAFNPALGSGGSVARGLLIVAAWGLVGLTIALRRFSWAPRGA
jgi:ABC-2 type transport system permease protein